MTQWQDTDAICTRCNGLGCERRQITHPEANVAGWLREELWPSNWWRRPCEACAGTGFRPMGQSVPIVPLHPPSTTP